LWKFAKKDEVEDERDLPAYTGAGKLPWVTMSTSARRGTPEAEPCGNVSGKAGRKKRIKRLKPKKRFRGFKFAAVDLRIGV
jgi:hypothetical protein